MKIAFLGTPRFSQIILEKLIDSPFRPQLVITSEDEKTGRGQKLDLSPVKKTAAEHNIKVTSRLSDLDPDTNLCILVAFGKIIPGNILKIPKHGFLNVHPSLLPLYRGPSPIQSAILDGAKETGVTIMKLDEELDHGPILARSKIEIADTDTHESLIVKLANLGADLLIKTIPDYINKSFELKPQHHIDATWTEKITKATGHINLTNPPNPLSLNRMIRAYFPWPTVWSEINGKRIKFLPEGKIQMEGKKPMTIKEFLNGYPNYKNLIEKIFKL